MSSALVGLALLTLVALAFLYALNQLVSVHLRRVRHGLLPPVRQGASQTSGLVLMHYIFYPSSPPSPLPTFLYGWQHRNSTLVAGHLVATTHEEAKVQLDQALKQLDSIHSGTVVVLGSTTLEPLPALLHLPLDAQGIPTLKNPEQTLVLYSPPSPDLLQFISLLPLQLDLTSFSGPARKGDEDVARHEHELLSDKIRKSLELDFSRPQVGQGDLVNLQDIVDKINLAPHLSSLLSPPLSLRQSFPLLPVTLSRSSTYYASLRAPLRPLLWTARALLGVSEWEIPGFGGMKGKDFSATVQQIDTRLSQGLSWDVQYGVIRKSLRDTHSSDFTSLAVGRAHYIHFYNTMWLIANDVIVGSALASYFCENSVVLGEALAQIIQVYTLTSLREVLLWLNDWPGGVKLNFELAKVFCDAFLWGTGLWETHIFLPLVPHFPSLIYLLGLTGCLGTTLFISFASDLLSLLTLHIYLFYLLATCCFSWHLTLLGALFNIFRGKKFNILRQRVEPASYEVDQLLLGTILFTLAVFLFPTVLAYYATFAVTRLVIVFLHALMETVLAFMNHFPLFAVMLRLKDSARLPGGLEFELCTTKGEEGEGYLRMRNNPLHLAGIFFAHLKLSRRLASHYSPVYLLGRLLTGKIISPIPRLRLTYFSVSNLPSITLQEVEPEHQKTE